MLFNGEKIKMELSRRKKKITEDQQKYQEQYKIMYSCNSCRVQSPSIPLNIYWERTTYPALYLLPGIQQYAK